jgi:formate C-acetyltransferase
MGVASTRSSGPETHGQGDPAAGRSFRFEQFFTIKPTTRVHRLREVMLSSKATYSIARARIETRVMRETEGEPMLTRRAKVFAAIAREMPINILTDELIVGNPRIRPNGVFVNPANGPGTEGGIEHGSYAGKLSDTEIQELRDELIPYWKGSKGHYEHTVMMRNQAQFSDHLRNLLYADPQAEKLESSLVYSTEVHHYGHNTVGYVQVRDKGFLGIKQEAEDRLATLDPANPRHARKIQFVRGVITAMEAAAEIGPRFAAEARVLAKTEADSRRQAELLEIAEVCDRVPAHPARTFHEALQSHVLGWMLLFWESPTAGAHSPGRMDQFLQPFFERDLQQGRISRERVQELLDVYFIKLNEVWQSPNLTVGGVKANGQDATNEMSYMLIEAMMHTRLIQPYLSVLVHHKMPNAFLKKASELCLMGTGHPQFISADVMVDQALARGGSGGPAVTLEDARSANGVGCIELVIPGKDSGYGVFSYIVNLGAAMEFVLTNGWSRHYNRQMGARTGDPRKFESFDQVLEAFRRQVEYITENRQQISHIQERTLLELSPTLYESALIEGCLEKAMCREEGGAHYNFNTGSVGTGAADAGDSLTAIRKLVFEDKMISMDELCDALAANYEGHEHVRRMLIEVPKFGIDDDHADEQTAFANHVFASESRKLKNLRGGYSSPGGSAMSGYVYHGIPVGALPSGRLAGQPFADGHSPYAGNDIKGPTAALRSMGKIDNVEITGGVILNMRLSPVTYEGDGGVRRLNDLIRAFIDQRIFHVQINVVSTETLRAAQREPENYRDLVVKVSGYNEFFVKLPRVLQDVIIARTEHGS